MEISTFISVGHGAMDIVSVTVGQANSFAWRSVMHIIDSLSTSVLDDILDMTGT